MTHLDDALPSPDALRRDLAKGHVLGFRKAQNDAGFAPIYRPRPSVMDSRFRPSTAVLAAVHRINLGDDSMAVLADAAPEVSAALAEARRAAAEGDVGAMADAQDRFFDVASEFGDRTKRRARAGVVSKADAAAYSVLGPLVMLPQVVERVISKPTLIGSLPMIALNTIFLSATYHRAQRHSALPVRSFDVSAIVAGASATVTLEPVTIRLAPSAQPCVLTDLLKTQAAEARTRAGLPDWDLWDDLLEATMDSVYQDIGGIVAHGDPKLSVNGVLTPSYLTAVPLNYDSGIFLTDYNVVAAQIAAQATGANDAPELVANTLWIDSTTFNKWAGVLISSTGDSTPPLLEVLRQHPTIDEIYSCREFRQDATLLAALTAKIGDVTEATRRSGGLIVGGASKRCLMIGRRDPLCGNWIEGQPLGVQALEPKDGADRAIVRASTGGFEAFQKSAYRIVYIP